ncbi:imidazoleglycerol-phosphate dehydratase HisB [candidate division NPL-UPA2 bacterium]|nr:imidazoleglycerol-phosphate dehydratase HisB [candidate division NPL-UPA2 bacterium]
MRARRAKVERRTRETKIKLELDLDGQGKYKIDTNIPFLNHMLSLLIKHGLFDLSLTARGDLEVDEHHTVEDIGISLGEAFKKALGKRKHIRRFGFAYAPMDEALALTALDISSRPYLAFNVPGKRRKVDGFAPQLVEEFLRAFSTHGGITVHVNLLYGKNSHHILEAIFKALGQALDQATQIDNRVKGVPSTKGKL